MCGRQAFYAWATLAAPVCCFWWEVSGQCARVLLLWWVIFLLLFSRFLLGFALIILI
jgi:hypothetical protein